MLHRPLVFLGAVLAALALAAPALGLSAHVRVEGVTTTLFGAAEPSLTPFTGTLVAADGSTHELAKPTALGALEAASRRAELYYRLRLVSFGLYVDRIGRYPAAGPSGWVYKVNGVSPPVGAADYVLKEGDRVLWYFAKFGPAGGPKTLELEGMSQGCFRAIARDDKGQASRARGVVFVADGQRIRSPGGQFCPAGRYRTVRATKPGAVRSEVVVL